MANPLIENSSINDDAGAGLTRTATLTTTLSNLAVATIHSEVGGGAVVQSVTSPGLTWTRFTTISGNPSPLSESVNIEIWYAPLSGAYSGSVVATFQNPPNVDSSAMVVFGVENGNTSTPFDTNGTLPGQAWNGSNQAIVSGVDTTDPNAVVLALFANSSPVEMTTPAGYALVANPQTGAGSLWMYAGVFSWSPGTTLSGYTLNSGIGGAAPLLGLAAIQSANASVNVPNIVGDLLSVGESALTTAGLVTGAITYASSLSVPAGYIISTTPVAGTSVFVGSSVAILVSLGPPATVPNVINLTESQANTAIVGAGLVTGTVTTAYSGSIAAGNVISSSPVAGTGVTPGSSVDIVVSLGASATVPDLDNTGAATYDALLAAAGLVLGTVAHEPSGVIIAGNVISQSPAPSTVVPSGSAVNVVVSSGLPPLTVPDLFGLDQTDAVNLLLSLGLVPGAIGSAPSQFVPPGEVQAQNPNAGIAVAVGTIVSFVLSQGTPVAGTLFDFEATVISQYANSPTILQLCNNLNQYIDQSANFANFFNFVWNVDTAVGFGLDIWGKIVGVSRLLHIPNTTDYVGFDNGTRSPPDWQSMGSDQPPYNMPPVGGAMYTGNNATQTYLLGDDAYRQLILAKAFANITTTTAPAINQILQNLYGPGTAFVLNEGPMAISYNLTFTPTAIQLAILQQSGVIPTPPGVSVVINTNV